MPVRMDCTATGFERNWIEIADAWTRREVESVLSTSLDAEYVQMLQRKTLALHLELATGDVIDDPAALTYNALLDADELLLGWLGYVLPTAIAQRRLLGNASLRLSSNSSGIAARKLQPAKAATEAAN